MRRIAAFDFDGTLTTRDTLIAFIRYACGSWSFAIGFLYHLPLLVLMKLGCFPNGESKQRVFSYFFRGMHIEEFSRLCQQFAADNRHLLRPSGIQTLEQLREQGVEVVIVTASIKDWVQPFFPTVSVIATLPEVRDGLLTGRFLTPNCHGREKVTRLLQQYPDRQTYHLTAYGDSSGDRELLSFADEAHFKPFRVL